MTIATAMTTVYSDVLVLPLMLNAWPEIQPLVSRGQIASTVRTFVMDRRTDRQLQI